MTRIPDWNNDLDALYGAALSATGSIGGTPHVSTAELVLDPVTRRSTELRVTVPAGDRSWATAYGYTPSHWVILHISHAAPEDHPAGSLLVHGWAVRHTDDGLTELALLAATLEPPRHVSVLTPSRRPEKRAKPGDMTLEHATHRVWQLVLNRASAVTLDDDTYPKTTALDGMNLYGATRYNRVKARGTLHGIPFKFETTNNGHAHLMLDHDRNGYYELYGPVPVPPALHDMSADEHLSVLIPQLWALVDTERDDTTSTPGASTPGTSEAANGFAADTFPTNP
jgi:hypothetical protein